MCGKVDEKCRYKLTLIKRENMIVEVALVSSMANQTGYMSV